MFCQFQNSGQSSHCLPLNTLKIWNAPIPDRLLIIITQAPLNRNLSTRLIKITKNQVCLLISQTYKLVNLGKGSFCNHGFLLFQMIVKKCEVHKCEGLSNFPKIHFLVYFLSRNQKFIDQKLLFYFISYLKGAKTKTIKGYS